MTVSTSPERTQSAPSVSPDVPTDGSKMSPDVPECPQMSPKLEMRQTKPSSTAALVKPLSPIQLAAARHFAKGARTAAIATALQINRRTLSRWKRMAEFRQEIERVHRALSQPPARPTPSPNLPPSERQFLERVYSTAMKHFMQL